MTLKPMKVYTITIQTPDGLKIMRIGAPDAATAKARATTNMHLNGWPKNSQIVNAN